MLPWSAELAGRIENHVFTSDLLRGNPLGDPHERPLLVYTPPGYDESPERRYPVVYVIQGYTGHVAMWWNRSAFRTALLDAGVADDVIRFELFDATHGGVDYRYPLSLAWLCERIAA